MAIYPLYFLDLDGRHKPPIAYKGNYSHEANIPFFHGRRKGKLARKIYKSLKSCRNQYSPANLHEAEMTLIPNSGEILFITFNVHGKKPLFRNPKACSFFLHTLRYYKPQLKFQLLGYVVMEDHIHLLMRTPPDVSISAIIQKIKGAFGRKWKMMSHWKGPVWQKSFFNTILHDDASLKHRLNQMHNHPGLTGFSPSKTRYTYSSAMVYEEGIDDFLTDRISV